MPDAFYDTELLKLYKGKGVRLEFKSNRFLHLKSWGPKLYEKLIMSKKEDKLFGHTPSFQVGGQRMGSTNEHLFSMITVMRRLERERVGGGIVLMDIRSCFDQVRLNDILFEGTQCGIVGRPLRAIQEYTDNLRIRMRGDPNPDRCALLSNTTGQGSSFAPVGTSMVMARTLANNIDGSDHKEKLEILGTVKGLELKPNFFVDDLAKPCQTVHELKATGKVITKTLNELSLSAHPEKSGILIFGGAKEKLEAEIITEQPQVQGFNLAIKGEETYLGMIFSSLGASDSIMKTLINRRAKCMSKAGEIKRKLADERMMGVGWLAAASTIFSSVIVSTLTYGAAAMTGMNAAHWDLLEMIQRQSLIHVLDISHKCTYKSLLYVMGILPAADVVKKLQICFVNNLIHIKEGGQCLETILKDEKIGGIKGLLGEVREYCLQYGLPDVTKQYVPAEVIKNQITRKVLDNLWVSHLVAKKPPAMIRRDDLTLRFYSNLPKNKAKLALSLDVGELNFRRNRKYEAMKKYGSISCLKMKGAENSTDLC